MRSRGSALILVLLFMSLFLVMGMGFLASKSSQYRSVRRSLVSAQARSLAMAGIEETVAKMIKDYDFPPQAATDQPIYQVNEEVFDLDGTTRVGEYQVRIQTDKQGPPYWVIVVRSTGLVGEKTNPQGRRTLEAWIDLRDPETNPRFFQIISIKDLGGI